MTTPPSSAHCLTARAHVDALAKPPGSLGRLEELAVWIAACQRREVAEPLHRPTCVVLAGDHGVLADGVSTHGDEITAAMVAAVLAGRAGVNALAGVSDTTVELLDISCRRTADELPGDAHRHRLGRGCPSIRTCDAMTGDQVERALATGDQIAAEQAGAGTDLLIVGDLGLGNTTPATALICALTGADPAIITGRGTGLDDDGLARKRAVIAEALERSGHPDDPRSALAALGSPDLAVAVGLMLGAARRGIPVLVDGLIAAAEALVAARIDPGVTAWLRAGHRSAEPGASIALATLGLEPLLELGMRLGEGSGAVAAVPLVQQAIAMARDMARLDELAPPTATAPTD